MKNDEICGGYEPRHEYGSAECRSAKGALKVSDGVLDQVAEQFKDMQNGVLCNVSFALGIDYGVLDEGYVLRLFDVRDRNLGVISIPEVVQTVQAAVPAAAVPTAEELEKFLNGATHAPAETHSQADGTCSECPWPRYQLPPADLARELHEFLAGGKS